MTKARCATCGAEFVGTHVCPVTTTVTSPTGYITSYGVTGTTGTTTIYTATQYNGRVGKTFRCPHIQIANVEKVVCAVCGELKPDE